jgi:hypothetical protein
VTDRDRAELADIDRWLRGDLANEATAEAPAPKVQLSTPSYLHDRATQARDPLDETKAVPDAEELKRKIEAAEPGFAMARAAATRSSANLVAPDAIPQRASEAGGETELAPTPEEIKALIQQATPFRSTRTSAPPMGTDDYAALQALCLVRGEEDEAVRARYGTDSAEDRRRLDLRMEQHFAAHPDERARYDERFQHFLHFLTQTPKNPRS